MKRICLFLAALLFLFAKVTGQTIAIKKSKHDPKYIKDYHKNHLIIRAFESTKFNNFQYSDHKSELVFKPNKHNNFGLGFTYKFLSLNFGFYIPNLGRDIDVYGKTRQLDLQTHFYMRNIIVDFYGQFYHGYYLANSDAVINNPNDDILNRPDIRTRNLSLVCQYLFNDKQFSYNAVFYQNELQKKSAGSFLVGGGIYHTALFADSSLIPPNANYTDFFNSYPFKNSKNTAIGVNGGYAYTLVIKKYFFITGYLSSGAGLNLAVLADGNDIRRKAGLQLNLSQRLAAGYNSDRYFAGITYIRQYTKTNATQPGCWQDVNSGNFRVIVARRFRMKKALLPDDPTQLKI